MNNRNFALFLTQSIFKEFYLSQDSLLLTTALNSSVNTLHQEASSDSLISTLNLLTSQNISKPLVISQSDYPTNSNISKG